MQTTLFARNVIVNPCLAHSEPFRNITDVQQLIGVTIGIFRHKYLEQLPVGANLSSCLQASAIRRQARSK
jgi:hypothetical protein